MLLFLFACTPSVDDTAGLLCAGLAPSLVVGTGEREFETLDEGDEVIMVHGPQGGWHMLGSIQLFNTSPIVEIDFTITDIQSGAVVSSNYYRVGLLMEDDCNGYYPGMYGYLNVQDLVQEEMDTPPELLGGHELEMEMKSNDCTESQNAQGICNREDRWSTNKIHVTAALDPIDME